jgi:hypothetical protein
MLVIVIYVICNVGSIYITLCWSRIIMGLVILMNAAMDNSFTTSELQAINACRLYLQVTMLSEITAS